MVAKGFSNISAVDLSKEQVEVAKRLLELNDIEYEGLIDFVVVDAFSFLAKGEKYKAIFLIDVVEHFEKEKVFDLVNAAHYCLDPSGILLAFRPLQRALEVRQYQRSESNCKCSIYW